MFKTIHLCKFRLLRRLINQKNNCVHIESTKNDVGSETNPLKVDQVADCDLSTLETVCNLLDSKANKRVASFSGAEVERLDRFVEQMGVDHERYKYFHRTTIGNEM